MGATPEGRGGLDRRRFLAFFAALGLAGTSLPRRLWAAAAEGPITRKVLARAEQLAGLEFTDDERQLMLEGLNELRDSYARIRQVKLDNSVPPAFRFDPHLEPPAAAGPGPGARPNGFRSDGTPTSISFTGQLFGEADLLAVAKAYQDATDFHQRRPPLAPPEDA